MVVHSQQSWAFGPKSQFTYVLGWVNPQWEVREVVAQVPDGVLVLLWHQTFLILAQQRWLLSSRALSLKPEQDLPLLGICFSSPLLCLTSPKFSTPFSSLSSSIYNPLLVGSSWWGDIPYDSRSLRIISLVRGNPLLAIDMTF